MVYSMFNTLYLVNIVKFTMTRPLSGARAVLTNVAMLVLPITICQRAPLTTVSTDLGCVDIVNSQTA
jgi:hypothetical protein